MLASSLRRYVTVSLTSIVITISLIGFLQHDQQSTTTSHRKALHGVSFAAAPESMYPDREPDQLEPAAHAVRHRRLWRLPNRLVTQYDDDVRRRLEALTSRRARATDPEVVGLARDLLDLPIDEGRDGIKHPRYIMKTPQAVKVDGITNKMRDGFFVECGALDGERSSNTIFLEKDRGWTGLLVEMDPYFYTQLLGKNRRVFSINACLSPYNYITTLEYKGDESGRGRLSLKEVGAQNIAAGVTSQTLVPCFPLESLLLAVNRTRVDYFSLDVEGVELPILRTVPWTSLDIRVLSVEYGHGPDGKRPYVDYMTGVGYSVHSELVESNWEKALFVEDFLFVKNKPPP